MCFEGHNMEISRIYENNNINTSISLKGSYSIFEEI